MNLAGIMQIIAQLMDDEQGCEWTKAQDFKSLRRYSIEEAFELVEAIDRGNIEDIKKELGDLLFQVLFISSIAHKNKQFAFSDVVILLGEKLKRRNPHVFDEKVRESYKLLESRQKKIEFSAQQWQKIKSDEKSNEIAINKLHDGISRVPWIEALTLLKNAAAQGYKWHEFSQSIAKVEEEIKELKLEVLNGNEDAILDEYGDCLFSMIAVGESIGIDPNLALMQANSKFRNRFYTMQMELKKAGIDKPSLQQMLEAWKIAKTDFLLVG